MNYLAIALGGAIGALMRYSLWVLIGSQSSYWATLVANIVGCFLLGVLWVFIDKAMISEAMRLLLMVGVLGSLTTFSTFSLELLLFWQQQEYMTAFLYFVCSVVGGIAAMLIAIYLVRSIIH